MLRLYSSLSEEIMADTENFSNFGETPSGPVALLILCFISILDSLISEICGPGQARDGGVKGAACSNASLSPIVEKKSFTDLVNLLFHYLQLQGFCRYVLEAL